MSKPKPSPPVVRDLGGWWLVATLLALAAALLAVILGKALGL